MILSTFLIGKAERFGISLYSHHSAPSYSFRSSQKSFPTTFRSRATSFPPYPESYLLSANSKNCSFVIWKSFPQTPTTSDHFFPCFFKNEIVSSPKLRIKSIYICLLKIFAQSWTPLFYHTNSKK